MIALAVALVLAGSPTVQPKEKAKLAPNVDPRNAAVEAVIFLHENADTADIFAATLSETRRSFFHADEWKAKDTPADLATLKIRYHENGTWVHASAGYRTWIVVKEKPGWRIAEDPLSVSEASLMDSLRRAKAQDYSLKAVPFMRVRAFALFPGLNPGGFKVIEQHNEYTALLPYVVEEISANIARTPATPIDPAAATAAYQGMGTVEHAEKMESIGAATVRYRLCASEERAEWLLWTTLSPDAAPLALGDRGAIEGYTAAFRDGALVVDASGVFLNREQLKALITAAWTHLDSVKNPKGPIP